jgi:hypothetical protein
MAWAAQLREQPGCGLGQGKQLVVQMALAHRGGAHHQRAVGDRVGHAGAAEGGGHYGGRVDRGPGLLQGHGIVVDDAQAAESEVVHGAGHGADVAGVARADQNYADTVELGFGEHRFLL